MCLITKQKTATIIDKDMVVVKSLYVDGNQFFSSFQRFEYIPNTVYITDIKFTKNYEFHCDVDTDIITIGDIDNLSERWIESQGYIAIDKGFHSINMDALHLYKNSWFFNYYRNYEFIIPAGSEIYTNEDTGLIVSNQIIFTGKQLNF